MALSAAQRVDRLFRRLLAGDAAIDTCLPGGWLPPLDVSWLNWIPGPIWLALKISFFLFLFILARAAYPRYRYDQLMRLGWKVFLPLTLVAVVVYAGVLLYAGWLPK